MTKNRNSVEPPKDDEGEVEEEEEEGTVFWVITIIKMLKTNHNNAMVEEKNL